MQLILFLLVFPALCLPRNPHRKKEPDIPYIQVKYTNSSTETEALSSSFLQEVPIFKTFNKVHFYQNLLPNSITIGNQTISNQAISEQIENLIEELNHNKKNLTNFSKLKTTFNKFKQHGFLVLKFKDYPLVLKLFMETPYGLTHPYEKGFEERGMFTMGGSNRYFLGFTRTRNKDNVRKILDKSEKWNTVTMPRKWTWLPNNTRWLQIDGYNIGNKKHQQITTPSTYAIICEEVIEDGTKIKGKGRKYLQLCTDLEYLIDPRSINFKVIDNKFVMLDTEHFPTLVGAKRQIHPSNRYSSWYVKIGGTYVRKGFLASKSDRKYLQKTPNIKNL